MSFWGSEILLSLQKRHEFEVMLLENSQEATGL